MENTEVGIIMALIAGLGFIFFLVFIVLIIAICVVEIIANWKIFEKAGEEGWKAIIPIYNTIVFCQISGTSPWWILIVYAVSFIAGFIGAFFPPATILGTAASVYFSVILSLNLAKCFKKDTGYAMGLVFLGIVFYPMLGFGKDTYEKAEAVNDPIMKFFIDTFGGNNNQNTNYNTQNTVKEAEVINEEKKEEPKKQTKSKKTEETKKEVKTTNPKSIVCPNCGEKIEEGKKFCTNCGNKLEEE